MLVGRQLKSLRAEIGVPRIMGGSLNMEVASSSNNTLFGCMVLANARRIRMCAVFVVVDGLERDGNCFQ